MRQLRFGSGAAEQERFALLYGGFCAGADDTPGKGLEVERRVGRILDGLEAVGVSDADGNWALRPEGGEVDLGEPEFALLVDYLKKWSARAAFTRKKLALLEWLEAIAPTAEPPAAD